MLALAGALFTLQGLGYVGGSVMSGETFWAITGPIIAGFGVALVFVGLRGGSHAPDGQCAATVDRDAQARTGSGRAPGSFASSSRACAAADLCSTSTSYLVATTWVIEEKSRWPRLKA